MPYIITTQAPDRTVWEGNRSSVVTRPPVTRRAVATLDEASDIVIAVFEAQFSGIVNVSGIDEAGGTIGPLPDGTVIEVHHVDWIAMRKLAGSLPVRTHEKPEVLDAYNAAHAR